MAVIVDLTLCQHQSKVGEVARLTTLPFPAVSVPHYEPRFPQFDDGTQKYYPELIPVDTMGFVYER